MHEILIKVGRLGGCRVAINLFEEFNLIGLTLIDDSTSGLSISKTPQKRFLFAIMQKMLYLCQRNEESSIVDMVIGNGLWAIGK